MDIKGYKNIASELAISLSQVQQSIRLFEEGCTIPFISRYRKEITGSLDEVQLADIKSAWNKYEELEKRKITILSAIEEQGKLTDTLKAAILECNFIIDLEDIYLPYKLKRKTKAAIARENGLQGLADYLMLQQSGNVQAKAKMFLIKTVTSSSEALQGARDIIAETFSENKDIRAAIRLLFSRDAVLYSRVVKSKTEEAIKYKDYFDSNEKLNRCPSHRVLAIMRGYEEGFLRVRIEPDEETAIAILERRILRARNESSDEIRIAITDSYKRLISPSIENEFYQSAKEKADLESIKVFAENLKQLLLAAPLGPKRVLAIDPGFKSGCKLVCLDEHGNLKYNETIYPHPPQSQTKQAYAKISQLCEIYKIEAIAIGNGTAGRETENFIQHIKFNQELQVYSVNEQGASIYSASAVAREEFPEFDVTVRGAISIGRRLMDPLAELVKIDPKSIGVGQYQHDVDQTKLKTSLDDVVESAVNQVGVNINTASKHLLNYVSGVGQQLAGAIVQYRKEFGTFNSRDDLRNVPRLGAKAFEQCAGFLRIRNGKNPLDNTAVHPERYPLIQKIAKDLNCKIEDLIADENYTSKIQLEKYISSDVGLPTLTDILKELKKPGLDPRKKIKVFEFAKGITKPEHLQIGMKLPGIVTNITKFGAFVDIGVKQDGLVHLSNLANKFVSDPLEIVKLNQHVHVKIIDLDLPRKRIGLSLKEDV